MNSGCNQLCPYNTLEGCKAKENNAVCPASNTVTLREQFGLPPKSTIVQTGDWLDRDGKLYEVVIADDNIFVACPLKRSKKEKSLIVKYSRPEIYANQKDINSLTDLGFGLCVAKRR